MAGPTVAILFSNTLPIQISWKELMDEVADSWPDNDLFHIGNSRKFGGSYFGEFRPIVGQICNVSSTEESGGEIPAINKTLSTTISHVVEIGAMCKSPIDHRLLCEIASHYAKSYRGLVDFNGQITDFNRSDLFNITWVEDGFEFSTQVGRPSACDWWLKQPNFHMIK